MEDYNKHVEAALKRCQAISLTLKKDKCRFEAPQVTYLGHIISAEGISPDKEKVRAIAEMPPPEDKKGVERLLGVINYVSKFNPDMSTIIHPIREQLKKKIQFTWQWEQIKAFQRTPKVRLHDCVQTRKADALSRAFAEDRTTDGMEEELSCSVRMILKNSILPDVQLQKIKEATLEDTSLQQLSSIICSGWSARRTQVPSNLEMYWNFHDELSVADGIILKGEKMLIPTRLQKDMLTCIHTGHMGVTKCMQCAKEVMFWPGMSKEIVHVVLGCDRCHEYRVSNTKEPMLPGPTPDRPWDIVATDLFQWENRNYLLIVDYYSRYFERANSNLKPAIVNPEQVKKLKLKQQKQKKHYDRGSKALPNLKIGDHARMQVQGRWKPVVVTGQAGYPRSFIASTGDGRKYRRNRQHLMKATYEPELIDDLEVPPGEQREGHVQDDAHGNDAQEDEQKDEDIAINESPRSDTQEEEQRDEDIVIYVRQRQMETSNQHQPSYRTSRGQVISVQNGLLTLSSYELKGVVV
eukprot:Em0001g593a